ncbi:MAG: 2-amino-4-hydroxy-6-hydroxymethyldihydropteridine diphosphokinase [Bacteroidia bacterium]|nr:2-amino-4-hydroxy-6-hydroxymethyldihydropteridine diphosphokinase [Bacteroidia bacterium]MDW8089645.1 2-amino-4-hydroxy-6-hydroxymethyldihydropteridine diphosphokinase [Bacteroidia bacterium]
MIFIGVGSNLGDRWGALSQAWQLLQAQGVWIRRSSPVYETVPWGEPNQPFYLNAVWEVETAYGPEALLDVLKAVERALGRSHTEGRRWGPRIIDLDLLAYGAEVRSTEALILPHPWIPYRPFVLGPWKDIAPMFYLGTWRATVGELWRYLASSSWGFRADPPRALPLPPIACVPIPSAPPTS